MKLTYESYIWDMDPFRDSAKFHLMFKSDEGYRVSVEVYSDRLSDKQLLRSDIGTDVVRAQYNVLLRQLFTSVVEYLRQNGVFLRWGLKEALKDGIGFGLREGEDFQPTTIETDLEGWTGEVSSRVR